MFFFGGGGGGVHLGIVLANSVDNKQNKTKFKELEIVTINSIHENRPQN